MKILILGHKGMLGHMVLKFFNSKGLDTITTDLRWPTKEFKNFVKNFEGEYIINCIGAIHQKTDNFEVNYELPEFLESLKVKIIHPGTDCEMDDDDYGLSKRKASDWIKKYGENTKIIKTSIFGPELDSKASLFEWFLDQEEEVNGYDRYYWNGNTTLTWAQYCLYLMFHWDEHDVETILEGDCMSKHNLLLLIKEVYNKKINIIPVAEPKHNKCLEGNVKTLPLKQQLTALKEFY